LQTARLNPPEALRAIVCTTRALVEDTSVNVETFSIEPLIGHVGTLDLTGIDCAEERQVIATGGGLASAHAECLRPRRVAPCFGSAAPQVSAIAAL
jgi:hypothetical protein